MKTYCLTAIVVLLAVLNAPSAAAQSQLHIAGVPPNAPFKINASATDTLLLVELAFDREWHAYSRDVGGGQPVRLVTDKAGDFAADGALDVPGDPYGKLSGAVRLALPISRTGEGRTLRAKLDMQVCDALKCLPPMSITLNGTVDAASVLLVVAQKAEREERIAGWLTARGFDVQITTYKNATREACNDSDIVLCDSQLFREDKVGLDVVHAFPKSETPIVAAGFLGTELVEAHGLAMTSGYI